MLTVSVVVTNNDVSKEIEFQNDIIAHMQAKPEHYDRATALNTADVLSFVKGTQPKDRQTGICAGGA